MRIVSEAEFAERIRELLQDPRFDQCGSVTGPGRSGAIAAVYASHILRIPFIPYGAEPPAKLGRLLIVDTATETGQTIQRASKRYNDEAEILVCYHEPPRVAFWYEGPKPQRYRHERQLCADNSPTALTSQ